MNLSRIIIILLSLLSLNTVICQINCGAKISFLKEDSIALSFSNLKYKNHIELAKLLTSDINNELSKFRVIYRWIAENIEYDAFYKSSNAEKVLKTGKAVCEGYSALLKQMCVSVGLKCEIVKGFSSQVREQIKEKNTKPDHSWNTVFLNGKWQLCDVTWSAGYLDERTEKMSKRFSDTYFLMEPKKFIQTHYPENSTWQLLDTILSKSYFQKIPIYYPAYYDFNLQGLFPSNENIKLKLKDTLTLKFKTDCEIDSVNMELIGKVKRYSSELKEISKNNYVVKQKFDESGENDLIIYLNRRAILGYKLKSD